MMLQKTPLKIFNELTYANNTNGEVTPSESFVLLQACLCEIIRLHVCIQDFSARAQVIILSRLEHTEHTNRTWLSDAWPAD